MSNARFFVYILVLMVVITCVCARARTWNNFDHHHKRIFGCVESHGSCKGLFKSCCQGYRCDSTTGYCVSSGSSGSWLDNRNGK